MKLLVLTCLLACAHAYTDLVDTFKTEDLVKNVDQLREIVNCFTDAGPCTDFSLKYKNHMKEALDDACRECNDRQKHQFRLVFEATKNLLPKEFDLLRKKYDPTGIHFKDDVQAIKKY